jgi:hypothetical protein
MRTLLQWVGNCLLFASVGLSGCSNHIPRFLPIGNKTLETGKTFEFEVEAVDDDGDPLNFGIEDKPSEARFEKIDDHRAKFSWTPLSSDAGEDGRGKDYPVTFLVTDGIDASSERVLMTVILSGSGAGAPVFISPSDFTLDLDHSKSIRFDIEVRDADSIQVDLSLVEGLPGDSEFNTMGTKTAEVKWTPSEAQIAEKPVWGIRVKADDGDNPPVFQDITILLRGGAQKCPGTPPEIGHDSLPDQRGNGVYPVTATVTDAESEIGSVALYWMKGAEEGGGGSSFTKVILQSSGGGRFQGSIPNAGLSGSETVKITYYICALDKDDTSGGSCNHRTCSPKEGRYSFTAYASGSAQCENDGFDTPPGNGTFDKASVLQIGEDGFCEHDFLQICPGDVDWFKLNVPANSEIDVMIFFTRANGDLKLQLYSADGQSMLAEGVQDQNIVETTYGEFSQGKAVLIKVFGAQANPPVSNGYQMLLNVSPKQTCSNDAMEPNDLPGNAKGVVGDHVYSDLKTCGDNDWYKVDLNLGDQLKVQIEFTQANGDLDLGIFDSRVLAASPFGWGIALVKSTTDRSPEGVTLQSAPAAGTYYIGVIPYLGSKNTYKMTVFPILSGSSCTDDAEEGNDTPSAAKGVTYGVEKTGLVICPGDDDWFKMYAAAGDTLWIEMTASYANGDLDMELYDPDVVTGGMQGHRLDYAMSAEDIETIIYSVSNSGTYYIRIYGFMNAKNNYSLAVDVL